MYSESYMQSGTVVTNFKQQQETIQSIFHGFNIAHGF
jgi:hypothetical protein